MTDVASPPRLIEFDGANNFRDLGGYPSRFGGHTRWGVLYRAGALHSMTATDLEKFADLGVRRVYDLRGDSERDHLPDPMPSIHVPVISKLMDRGPRPHFDGLTTADDGFAFMRDMNLALLNHCGVEFGQMIASFADPDTLPAVLTVIIGGEDPRYQIKALQTFPDIIVATPGRLLEHVKREVIDLDAINILVIDEADRMLDMGFIDDVEWILSHTPEQRQIALIRTWIEQGADYGSWTGEKLGGDAPKAGSSPKDPDWRRRS